MTDETGPGAPGRREDGADAGQIDLSELGADMAPAPDALAKSRPRNPPPAGSSPFKTVARGVPDDLGT